MTRIEELAEWIGRCAYCKREVSELCSLYEAERAQLRADLAEAVDVLDDVILFAPDTDGIKETSGITVMVKVAALNRASAIVEQLRARAVVDKHQNGDPAAWSEACERAQAAALKTGFTP